MIKTRQPDGGKGSQTVLHVLRDNHPLRWLAAIAVIVIGCKTYYHAVPGNLTIGEINSQLSMGKHFFLHIDKGDFALQDIRINISEKLITGTLAPITEEHLFYKETKPEGKATGYHRSFGDPTQEVHVYTSNYVLDGLHVELPMADIARIDIYEIDEDAMRKIRTIRAAIGVTIGLAVLVGVGLAIYASSMSFSLTGVGGFGMCPDIYVSTGTEYQFAGEMYGGAIAPAMERDDYLRLSGLQAADGVYALRIARQEMETEYTNLAEVVMVEHAVQSSVAFDVTGKVHAMTDARPPVAAVSPGNHDLLPVVARPDSAYTFFDEEAGPDRSMASIDLRFARPKDKQEGKLLIRGGSTPWQGYIYEKFIEQFGTGYHAYAKAQEGKSATDHYTWLREQGLSLSVYVEKKGGWILQEAIPPTGAGADRDIVVPIDLADVQGEVINVRLSCAFMAWQVDYAAMDFTPDEKMRMITIPPFTARDEKGEDVTHLITATDDRYLVQADSGSMVTVTYLAPPMRSDKAYTAFLHGRGYYTLDRAYTHKPNPGFTRQFQRDGQFSKFSKERYADLLEQYSVKTEQTDDAKR